jgi:hypothetical protein
MKLRGNLLLLELIKKCFPGVLCIRPEQIPYRDSGYPSNGTDIPYSSTYYRELEQCVQQLLDAIHNIGEGMNHCLLSRYKHFACSYATARGPTDQREIQSPKTGTDRLMDDYLYNHRQQIAFAVGWPEPSFAVAYIFVP